MNYKEIKEEERKAWWAKYAEDNEWSPSEDGNLIRYLRDGDHEREIRLEGPTSAAQWAYATMWMNRDGGALGQKYTASMCRERYVNHILPRLANQPLPPKSKATIPSESVSKSTQMIPKPAKVPKLLTSQSPQFMYGTLGQTLHSPLLSTEQPNYRAVAHLSMLRHDEEKSRKARPSTSAKLPDTTAQGEGVPDQPTSASEAAAPDEAAEAAQSLMRLLYKPLRFPDGEAEEAEEAVEEKGDQ